MQNDQNQQSRLKSVSAMIPVNLESRLHNLAAQNRHDYDIDYAQTFAQVVALGVDALQVRRSAAYVHSAELLKRVQG
jgi:hypothetical protein